MSPYEGIPQAADETGDASPSDSDLESRPNPKVKSFSQDNAIKYSSQDQIHRTAKRRILGLLFTILLVSLTFVILTIWKQKGYVPNSSITLFNFFTTTLSIALGINFSVGLTALITKTIIDA